jgi:hypothetical protein
MKKLITVIGCLVMAVTLVSCATYPIPITATGNDLGPRRGVSTGKIYFGLWGDASTANIPAAAEDGNIKKISTVEVQVENVLGVVQIISCVVTGE